MEASGELKVLLLEALADLEEIDRSPPSIWRHQADPTSFSTSEAELWQVALSPGGADDYADAWTPTQELISDCALARICDEVPVRQHHSSSVKHKASIIKEYGDEVYGHPPSPTKESEHMVDLSANMAFEGLA